MCVEDEGHAIIFRGAVAVVLLIGHQGRILVMVPFLEFVRAVADRVFTIGCQIFECGLVHWVVGGVSQAGREVCLRLCQLDGEGLIIHNLEPLELFAFLEAQNRLEKVGAQQ